MGGVFRGQKVIGVNKDNKGNFYVEEEYKSILLVSDVIVDRVEDIFIISVNGVKCSDESVFVVQNRLNGFFGSSIDIKYKIKGEEVVHELRLNLKKLE